MTATQLFNRPLRPVTPPRPTLRQRRTPKLRRGVYAAAATIFVVLLWQLAVDSGAVSRAGVASPSDTVRAAGPLLSHGAFWSAVGATVHSWAEGLAISLVVAIPLGLMIGASALVYKLTRFSIDFLRTIPPVALVPLVLLLYGATNKTAVVLIVFGSIWPVLLQTMYGVHQVDPVARDVARAYQFRRRERIFRLILPSALPFLATGIRISATISLLLAIGAEMIGGAPGIGNEISLQEQASNVPGMFVYIVASALLGVILNLALINLEGKVLKWHSSHRRVTV